MVTKSRFIEVTIEWKPVIELLQRAIASRHLLKFYFESKPTNKNKIGNKGCRTIRPYMIIPRGENLELVGLPITELSKSIEQRQPGHYIISQLEGRLKSGKFEVLEETFNDPGIPREKVHSTQNTPVYRFIFNDEDSKKVKAGWLRIKYI